jgi:hypothetical protein
VSRKLWQPCCQWVFKTANLHPLNYVSRLLPWSAWDLTFCILILQSIYSSPLNCILWHCSAYVKQIQCRPLRLSQTQEPYPPILSCLYVHKPFWIEIPVFQHLNWERWIFIYFL